MDITQNNNIHSSYCAAYEGNHKSGLDQKEKDYCKVLRGSHLGSLCDPWTIAHQVPLSVEFSRQEYWSVLPFPSPGDFPDPGNEPVSPALQVDSLLSEPPGKQEK